MRCATCGRRRRALPASKPGVANRLRSRAARGCPDRNTPVGGNDAPADARFPDRPASMPRTLSPRAGRAEDRLQLRSTGTLLSVCTRRVDEVRAVQMQLVARDRATTGAREASRPDLPVSRRCRWASGLLQAAATRGDAVSVSGAFAAPRTCVVAQASGEPERRAVAYTRPAGRKCNARHPEAVAGGIFTGPRRRSSNE